MAMAFPVEPEGWPRPRGYSNGMRARGELLAVAGQIGLDASQKLVTGGFVAQFEQALVNVVAVVRAAGGTPSDIVSVTIYAIDRDAYVGAYAAVGTAWRRVMGKHFPAVAMVFG